MKPRSIILGVVLAMAGISAHCKKSTTDDKKIWTDDFNRADGHPGASYSLYLPSGATSSILSQRLYPTNNNGAAPAAYYNSRISVGHTTSANFILSGVPANSVYAGPGYIIGRSGSVDSMNNAYVCGYYYTGGTVPNNLILGKFVGGILSTFGIIGLHSLVSGVSDTITFTMDGSTLKCALTGSSNVSISVADSTYADGYDGISGGSTSGNYLYVDNLSIQKL